MSAVRQVVVPPDARALSTLDRIDYEDGFLVELPSAQERTAEQWARVMLEDAPGSLRQSLPRGWWMLGLKHGPVDSEEHVLGWPIHASTPDVVLLGADSRLGMPAELLLKRQQGALFFATFVRQRNVAMRAVWAGIERQHRRVVTLLLDRAARST